MSTVDGFFEACNIAIRKKSRETFGYAKEQLALANSSDVVRKVAKHVISLKTAVLSNISSSLLRNFQIF